MSDFDQVLERLLEDAGFQASLAANPDSALRGYQLSADERALLHAQVVLGSGGDRSVETRTSKSGVVGLLGPVATAFGMAVGHQSLAPAGHGTFDAAPEPDGGAGIFGAADGSGGGTTGGHGSFGGAAGVETIGSAQDGQGTLGTARVPDHSYHTRVDVDGDGHWDSYVAYDRPDGGVDIEVDLNHDGKVDFIGHDFNRDGLVDSADYDTNFDGTMDTTMYDDNGDGWLDRSGPYHEK
jgi:hypothetical protein